MKIYYFGELIEENGVKVEKQTETKQISLRLEEKTEQEGGYMQSIGELLQEIDMSLDAYRPAHLRKKQIA